MSSFHVILVVIKIPILQTVHNSTQHGSPHEMKVHQVEAGGNSWYATFLQFGLPRVTKTYDVNRTKKEKPSLSSSSLPLPMLSPLIEEQSKEQKERTAPSNEAWLLLICV